MTTRDECAARDAADPLARCRDEFTLGDGLVYLDGNSLGPVSRRARERVVEALDGEWASGLVRSWNDAGWMDQPTVLGDRLARWVGARPGEVLVADTLTFAMAKLIGASLDLRPDRHVVLTDRANFHSDLYIVEAIAARAGRRVEVRALERDAIGAAIGPDVALVMLTHVDFRTGEMLDMPAITAAAHAAGALMLWDLAHSAGAVPVDLTGSGADFAAGCTYKYLNAGPGSPAFLYVRAEHQGAARNPLPGWLGHARPFDFEPGFEAAPGVRGWMTSSPSILALAALDGALDVFDTVTMGDLRAKSLALTDLFIGLVDERLPGEFTLLTPRDHSMRASQVALAHPDGYGVVQALIGRGVVGDFRDPDVCRFGFAPLYLRFVDVYDAVDRLAAVVASGEHREARFAARRPVT